MEIERWIALPSILHRGNERLFCWKRFEIKSNHERLGTRAQLGNVHFVSPFQDSACLLASEKIVELLDIKILAQISTTHHILAQLWKKYGDTLSFARL